MNVAAWCQQRPSGSQAMGQHMAGTRSDWKTLQPPGVIVAKGEGITASKLGESEQPRRAGQGTEPGSAQQARARGLCHTGASSEATLCGGNPPARRSWPSSVLCYRWIFFSFGQPWSSHQRVLGARGTPDRFGAGRWSRVLCNASPLPFKEPTSGPSWPRLQLSESAVSPSSLVKAAGTLGKAVKCFPSLSRRDAFYLGDGIPMLGGQVLRLDPAVCVPATCTPKSRRSSVQPRSGCRGQEWMATLCLPSQQSTRVSLRAAVPCLLLPAPRVSGQ